MFFLLSPLLPLCCCKILLFGHIILTCPQSEIVVSILPMRARAPNINHYICGKKRQEKSKHFTTCHFKVII